MFKTFINWLMKGKRIRDRLRMIKLSTGLQSVIEREKLPEFNSSEEIYKY